NNLTIYYLSPDLDKPIMDLFTDNNDLAEFLALKYGQSNNNKEDVAKYIPEASKIFRNQSKQPVRVLINSQKDLQALALFSGQKRQPERNTKAEYKQIEAENIVLNESQKELTVIEKKLQDYRLSISNGSATTANPQQEYNLMADDFNKQIKEYQVRADDFNKKVLLYNQNQKNQSPQIVEIGGGINLEAESFKIRTVESSPQLNNFKDMTVKAKTEWSVTKGEKWITNKVNIKKPEIQKPTIFIQPTIKNSPTNTIGQANKAVNRKTVIYIKTEDNYSPRVKGEFVNKNKIVFKRVF
ncbi:MAG: hypothetical protein WCH76_08435, partial [Candidatus Riflemargulisbacteria bacterium]